MNQIIIDNRRKIDEACSCCFQNLVSYSDNIKAFKQEKAQIAGSPYVQEEKMRQINDAEDRVKNLIAPIWEAIRDQIEIIHNAADAIADVPIEGVDLSAIGTLVDLLGGASSSTSVVQVLDSLRDYVDKYRGQTKALTIIRVAMERAGDPDPNALKDRFGNDLILSVRERISKLERAADYLQQPNINCAFDFAREMEMFAHGMGVELSDNFKKMMNAVNTDDYEDAYFARMSSLMGLDVAN